METKGCFICCVLMILVLSSTNVYANEDSHHDSAKPMMSDNPSSQPMRAERGIIKSAMKGAAVGAAAGGVAHMVGK
uniref:Uncharacterized protein n=1 Tax=Panagrolaimus sp. PS1159 TaxID=55785 RepID=A0AC35FGC9_9BILA